ncbi:MAG: hypothetical protein ACREIM_06455, partial [Nitrospiraceae bacterium]
MRWGTAVVSIVVAFAATSCTLFSKIDFPDNSCFENTSEGSRIYLAQCWDTEARRTFYTTNQGSLFAPYRIATYLELPGKNEPFLTPANIEKWKYIPASDQPYEWPVGFVKDTITEGQWKGEWIGLTCAACHTTEIVSNGKRLRIDGGSTLADSRGFISELDASLEETYNDGLQQNLKGGVGS